MPPPTPLSLIDLYKLYKKWVSSNPQTVGDVETAAKWMSYFIAGRINSSNIVTELIYSLSNLLVLFNDRIIQSVRLPYTCPNSQSRLKILLTALEYTEVFIELSAKRLWGEKGRWFFIVVVQVIKCIGRLLLTLKFKEPIVGTPPIAPLDRKNLEKNDEMRAAKIAEGFVGENSVSFKLKRSGKIVRKVEGSPPLYMRNWKPFKEEVTRECLSESNRKAMLFAEGLYILKPIMHLGAIKLFGYRSWKSYGLSLAMDLACIKMYYDNRQGMSKDQKLELSRRCVAMLLYLMRSPFFERYTENRLMGLVNLLGRIIPFSNVVCEPLLQYIPHYQHTYFYMWSS